MTKDEARIAVDRKLVVSLIEDTYHWGIASVLSDDESTMYIKPKGMNGARSAITIDNLEFPSWVYGDTQS